MTHRRWLFTLALAGLLPAAWVPLKADCTNRIVSETFSPAATLKAVVFLRDCGARTANAHLSILPAFSVLPAGEGNTFIGEGGVRSADIDGPHAVRVSWLSDSELSVLHGSVRMLRYESGRHGVKVFYGHLVDPPSRWPELP